MIRPLMLFTALIFSHWFTQMTANEDTFKPLVRDVKEIDLAEQDLPRNYRSTKDEIAVDEGELGEIQLRLEGLKELPMGGSAQFTEAQLKEILSQWGEAKVTIVDLREETHLILETTEGKQIPISAFVPLNTGNEGKSIEEIDYELLRYRDHILEQGSIALPYGKGGGLVEDDEAPVFEVSNVFTEKEVVEKLNESHAVGVDYIYLPITDHKKPTPQIVDTFLEMMKNTNESEASIFFHCRAGRGRTGMMMVMKDMLENARKYHLTFEQILKRQELLGSPDFSDVSEGKEEQSIERFEFLNHFYQYVLAEDGYEADLPYSMWLELHPITPEN